MINESPRLAKRKVLNTHLQEQRFVLIEKTASSDKEIKHIITGFSEKQLREFVNRNWKPWNDDIFGFLDYNEWKLIFYAIKRVQAMNTFLIRRYLKEYFSEKGFSGHRIRCRIEKGYHHITTDLRIGLPIKVVRNFIDLAECRDDQLELLALNIESSLAVQFVQTRKVLIEKNWDLLRQDSDIEY